MKVIGLTGGIGTGKSTAAEYLKKKGFLHIDADEIGRQLTADGSPMLDTLNDIFGPYGKYGEKGREIIKDDGSLDRQALAALVFTDSERKAQLDEVMFKAIIAEIDDEIRRYNEGCTEIHDAETHVAGTCDAEKTADEALSNDESDIPGIMLDAPLLFEAGLESRCDIVLLLVADEDIRIKRVCMRDGADEQSVRDRINSQMSDDEKMRRADIIIDNSESRDDLIDKLDDFIRRL